jgi:hypothetical protein
VLCGVQIGVQGLDEWDDVADPVVTWIVVKMMPSKVALLRNNTPNRTGGQSSVSKIRSQLPLRLIGDLCSKVIEH